MSEKELSLPKVPDRYKKMKPMPEKPPYNHDYRRGCLMNLSEKQEYDRWFPHHPLSEARQFVEDLARIN